MHYLNKVDIIIKSLTLYNVDLICKYVYYQVLYSRFYYLSYFILMLKKLLNYKFICSTPFKRRRIYTILRSPFIHKKSREQFEYRSFKRQIYLCGIFNTKYSFNIFTNNWRFLFNYPFRNNFIKIKLRNTYYLKAF
jgi:hypothetical protein